MARTRYTYPGNVVGEYGEIEIDPREGVEEELARIAHLYGPASAQACESMSYQLASWSEYIKRFNNNSYTCSSNLEALQSDPRPGEILKRYFFELERERFSEEQRFTSNYLKDERPYFSDPVPIGFDPTVVCAKDDGAGEEGVALRDVWKDPLARTLWLAIKARHLTSQYFRGACVEQAKWLRANPPRTVEEFHVDTGSGGFVGCSHYFRVQLYPYVVKILIDEKRWPWFLPPRSLVSDHVLGWTSPRAVAELPKRAISLEE